MNLKTLSMMGALLLLAGTGVNAQKKNYRGDKGRYGSCPSLFGKEYSGSCR